jgi:hypothetical protein
LETRRAASDSQGHASDRVAFTLYHKRPNRFGANLKNTAAEFRLCGKLNEAVSKKVIASVTGFTHLRLLFF